MRKSIARIVQVVAVVALTSVAFAASGSAQVIFTSRSDYTLDNTSQYTDLSQYMLPPSGSQGSNSSTINQIGTGNTANADVTALNGGAGAYFGNVTVQTQLGSNNSSDARAVGNSNALISTQVGSSNSSTLTANGNNNLLTATQTGAHDVSNVTAYGNGNNFNTVQVGSGLSVSIQQVGAGKSINVVQVR